MKVTKVDKIRIAVGKSETMQGAGQSVFYKNPNNGSERPSVENHVKTRVEEANKINEIFFRSDSVRLEMKELQRDFSDLIKELAGYTMAKKAYAGGKKEEISKVISQQVWYLQNKQANGETTVTKPLVGKKYNFKSDKVFQTELDKSLRYMKKSLKRGDDYLIAKKLMFGLAHRDEETGEIGENTLKKVVDELCSTNKAGLEHFIHSVNKDYYKPNLEPNLVKSIRNIDVRVQPAEDETGNPILSLTCASNRKHDGLKDTLAAYASSEIQADETLLSIKKILFSYFALDDTMAEYKYLTPETLWKLPKREEIFFDSFFIPADTKNMKQAGVELCVLFDKAEPDRKAVRKRINFVNYGTYLKLQETADSEMDKYWVTYIKEFVEKHYVHKKSDLRREDCFATAMLRECWKDIIRFLCGKYIDIGKAVYHFAMPENMVTPKKMVTSEKNEGNVPCYGKIREQYAAGITSFDYEAVKAEDTLQRDISVAVAAAATAVSRSVIDIKKQNDLTDMEDILFLEPEQLRGIQRDDAGKQLLRFYGGASSIREMEGVKDVELVDEIVSHLKALRNESYHYAPGKKCALKGVQTNKLYENDKRAFVDLVRQRYYANNVWKFYKTSDIICLVKDLYQQNKPADPLIPAFRNVCKRKDLVEDMRQHGFPTDEFANDADVTYQYEGALYFLLKDIYYRKFVVSKDVSSYFEGIGTKEKDKLFKKQDAFKNFREHLKKNIGASICQKKGNNNHNKPKITYTVGDVCQPIMQEHNQQNQKDEKKEKFLHLKLILSVCVKEAFWNFINAEYQWLAQPQLQPACDAESYLENVSISICDEKSELTKECTPWYTLAHFLHPRQLNHLIGDLNNYRQFRSDICRRRRYAGQGAEKNEGASDTYDIENILGTLEFVRGVTGRVSQNFEDYYVSKEAYAEYLAQYIDFPHKASETMYESLTRFCASAFPEGEAIYTDAQNPKVLRNVELARMYGGGDIRLIGYAKITEENIKDFYADKAKAEKILANGLYKNKKEVETVTNMQQLKNRIMLNEVTDIFSLVKDLLGELVTLAYLRERDEMYLFLGFYYMVLQNGKGWEQRAEDGTVIHTEIPDKLGSPDTGKYQVDGGLILYQICAIFDYELPLVRRDSKGKWTDMGGATTRKMDKFIAYNRSSWQTALRLFWDEKNESETVALRNYVDHSKYYTTTDRSLMDLYSGYYTKCFTYSSKLRKSVAFNFKNILEKYCIDCSLQFEPDGGDVRMKLVGNLTSQKFTYKLQEQTNQNGKKNKSGKQSWNNGNEVKLNAKSDTFLAGVKGILEYHG